MTDSRGPAGAPEPAPSPPAATVAGGPADIDPVAVIRSKRYLSALILAGMLGIPISAVAYGFLALVATIQGYVFDELPTQVIGGPAPAWWGVPWFALCGLFTALTIRYLPGNAGHSPAFGFKAGGGPPTGRELVGVILAALSTLCLGAVLGPEAPLIAVGGGLAALVVHLVKKDAPPMALIVMASAGSFAAISTLLGSPILAAFLIMEAAGIGGATLSLVALPGLLASGIGALIFVGLDSCTGLGDFSLALTSVPPQVDPTVAYDGLGAGHGSGRCTTRLGDPLDRPVLAPDRAPEPGPGDRGPRPAHRTDRDDLSAGHRQQLQSGVVLRAGCAPRTGRARRRLFARRPDRVDRGARRWPMACRSVRSGAARCSRRCSSAPPSASPPAGCRGWTWRLRSGWASVRCAPRCCGCR